MSSIEIFGAAKRSFTFPAPRPVAYEFYSFMPRIVPFLPRIELVATADNNLYRVAYRSLELNAYSVFIPCDLQVQVDETAELLQIDHVDTKIFPAVKPYASLRAAEAQGKFHIRSHFKDDGANQTRIDYELGLSSTLAKPLGLALVPTSVMVSIVERIVDIRINEIVDAFIVRSLAAYPAWLAEHPQSPNLPLT